MAVLEVAALATVDFTTPGTTVFDSLVLGLLSTLNVTGAGVDVAFTSINAAAVSTVNVSDGAKVTILGLPVGVLTTYNIGSASTLVFGAGASVASPINFTGTGGTLVIPANGLTLLTSVSGLAGNEIKTGGTIASYVYTPNGANSGTLAITNTDSTVINVPLSGSFTQADFISNPDGSVGIACFVRGTLLSTPSGQTAVEDLRCGDTLLTHSGRRAAVKWIGHRAYRTVAAAALDDRVAPVRIRRNAFAEGVPSRDLVVSPEHAMFLDGVLVPARALVNGRTVVQEVGARAVEYFHVELDRHDIILAEGAPTESWLDTGNRAMFDNAGVVVQMRPQALPASASLAWRDDACAKLVESGPLLTRIQKRLATRAEALDHAAGASAAWPAARSA